MPNDVGAALGGPGNGGVKVVNIQRSSAVELSAPRVQPTDGKAFSTFRINRLRHDFHLHPLLQLPELANLAREMMPMGKCRFVRPGMQQDSKFDHAGEHPEGRGIDEVFCRIEETGSWIALYNIESVPRYAALLEDILDTVREIVEREQPGVFNLSGFLFISAPPSVTPFHIDRENNFWLQLHGRKVLSVWDDSDRVAVPADSVEDFIVNHTLKKVKLTDASRDSAHEFDSGPGDGVYFPSTSPHATRTDNSWVAPGDGVSVSLGVTFYTSHTRRMARVHQVNRACRKYLHMDPAYPGAAPIRDRVKAPLGFGLAMARHFILRQLHAIRALREGVKPVEGWWGEKAPPGSY